MRTPRLLLPLVLTSVLAAACGGDTSPAPAPSRTTAHTRVDATARGLTAAVLPHFSDADVSWYGGSGTPGRHVDAALSFSDGAPIKTLYISADRKAVDPRSYRCGTDAGYAAQSCHRRATGVEEVLLSRVKGSRPAVIARRVTQQEAITVLAWPAASATVPLRLIRGVLRDPAIGVRGSLEGNEAGEKLNAFHQLRGGDTLEPESPR